MRGLSLIELMVSMVIGLFLIAGATTVYVNSRKTYDVDETAARLQETARYAMSILEADIRMANYWGLLKDGVQIEGKAMPATAASALVSGKPANSCINNFVVNVESHLQGDNNNFGFSGGSATGLCQPHSGNAVNSADTLTVRRASTTTQGSATQLRICSTRNNGVIFVGANSTCTSVAAGTGQINDLVVDTYYIDQESDHSATVPALRRKALIDQRTFQDVEIIPGVEDMQIQFGWDPSGTSATASRYVDPDNVPATGQIVAVRIWLLLRAENAEQGFTDQRVYEYGDRATSNGTTDDLNIASAATLAYAPNDNFRRLLVSRTIFIRNAVGT